MAHATYHNCLEDKCDIDKSNRYYNTVEQSKVQIVADAQFYPQNFQSKISLRKTLKSPTI